MELFVTIIFLLLLGSVLLYYSFREINWYFKKEEQKENFRLHVRESFLKRGYQIISMREPNKLEKKKNPLRNGVRIVLPAFFGAGERSFYWIVNWCESISLAKTRHNMKNHILTANMIT